MMKKKWSQKHHHGGPQMSMHGLKVERIREEHGGEWEEKGHKATQLLFWAMMISILIWGSFTVCFCFFDLLRPFVAFIIFGHPLFCGWFKGMYGLGRDCLSSNIEKLYGWTMDMGK